MSAEISRRPTLGELVATYEQAVLEIRAAFARVRAAEKTLQKAFDPHISVRSDRRSGVDFDDPDDCLVELRRQVWWAIIDRLEIRRLTSASRWEALTRQINDRWLNGKRNELPEVTLESVEALARQYESQLGELLEEKVSEVFEWLRPRSGTSGADYKTNQKNATLELGPKVILPYVFDPGSSFGWHMREHARARLSALESVFRALEGRGDATGSHYGQLHDAVSLCTSKSACAGETEYFRFRGFKNGNMHLEFRRLDLLDRFNKIAGGRRLRGRA